MCGESAESVKMLSLIHFVEVGKVTVLGFFIYEKGDMLNE